MHGSQPNTPTVTQPHKVGILSLPNLLQRRMPASRGYDLAKIFTVIDCHCLAVMDVPALVLGYKCPANSWFPYSLVDMLAF